MNLTHTSTGASAGTSARARSRVRLSKRMPRIGKIVISSDSAPVSCTVKNFNDNSAVLSMVGWIGLPSSFKLYIEPDNIMAHCQVTKQKGSSVQVEFSYIAHDMRFSGQAMQAMAV